jgi:predicted amidohydrolase YtcJ
MQAYLVSNGTILTMDPSQPEVEAFGVIGEWIVSAGSLAEVEAALPRGAGRLDLAGATCLPGFNEAHNHMLNFGFVLGRSTAAILRSVRSRRSLPASPSVPKEHHPAAGSAGAVTTTTS